MCVFVLVVNPNVNPRMGIGWWLFHSVWTAVTFCTWGRGCTGCRENCTGDGLVEACKVSMTCVRKNSIVSCIWDAWVFVTGFEAVVDTELAWAHGNWGRLMFVGRTGLYNLLPMLYDLNMQTCTDAVEWVCARGGCDLLKFWSTLNTGITVCELFRFGGLLTVFLLCFWCCRCKVQLIKGQNIPLHQTWLYPTKWRPVGMTQLRQMAGGCRDTPQVA